MTELIERDTATRTRWLRICRLDDLETGWGEAALVDGDQIALFRLAGDELYAVQHSDPVSGACVMARGITGSRTVEGQQRRTLASPLHKEIYDLADGRCYSDESLRLRTYPVRCIDDWLEIGAAA
ncbi:nitrite reductase small subunit NirD [Enemella evansiae]|uniref:Nitrite reductase (NAD(P)H) small subunit n=1 Tax=Enemella evansiae TaxID=2016499 RepID=A0A255GJM7_9ACTN|nr:nitrite reductase small subunit NirD [Enemella evansiae]PFG65936.1 assimilatory nitrite reductase (NAD(P)H) small subunit [Propionibacteriaceae bacterium ES.041]OYN97642.1 nitrite reductase (NAD(P)H) small subunit [Enemella evansiae]OYO00095.1 nitrite reductase (NAD(P)H) small subunit [Enemella evansiae]OYO04574.1 nitrite reductase (NAD(P)H) small subunit [Enemella evansiae]OYO09192.1 nitrite reductase (NAD(P)H) small subunit [Enemella evansiae]